MNDTLTTTVGSITFAPSRVKVRGVRVVKRNETTASKQYRLMVALVRGFAAEYPKEAAAIVHEIAAEENTLT